MHMPHTGLDEELLAFDEPMPFNDRPYFRRLVDFDRKKHSFRYEDPGWRFPFLDVSGADLFAIGVAMKVFQIYEGTPVLKDLKATFDRIARLLPESVRIAPSSLVEKRRGTTGRCGRTPGAGVR